jgi:hypothetical protein
MTIPAPTPDSGWFSRARAAAGPALGQAALWLVLWLSLLKLPAPPTSGLDPSWRMAIGYALSHGLQWGTDIVFTYGPLGYLLASTNHGANYADFLIWQGVSNVLFATVIWAFGRQFHGWRIVVYYLYFVFFVANYLDAMHMTIVLLLGLAWLRQPVAARRWLAAFIGVVLAILALIKFTNMMLAGFAVLCVAAHHIWRRRWVDLAVSSGSFVLSFLAGWLLCRQDLANIPAYVLTSLNASSGYGEGMALYEQPLVLAIGLGGALTLAVYYLLSLWGRRDLPLALASMLIAAASTFMNWKHGYTRADGHVFAHYISCLLVPVTFPVLLADDGPFPRIKAALLWIVAACSIWGILAVLPASITDAPAAWNYNLKKTINSLGELSVLKRNARAEFDTVAQPHIMPGIRTKVGNYSIDMIGNEQAYLIFNHFNYTPRPVFQSYLPYTAELMRLNEAFFQSERAPLFVLHKMDTIDYRLPPLEDSLSTRYLYYHYSYVMEERGMQLWRRNPPDPSLDGQTLLSESTVEFGQSVPVPDHGDTPIWCEVVARPSLLGSARAFLYKAPILTMEVTDAGGFKSTYRVIRRMAEAGFMIYPYFTSGYNVQRFMAGEPAQRVQSFALQMPLDQRKYFQSGITVKFYTLKPIPRTPGIQSGSPEEKFRVFDRVPVYANALYPIAILQEGDKEVLFAHPPSTIEFQVNFPATRVSGKFGFAAGAYKPPNLTDGAEFIIEWIGAEGSTQLFKRLLAPAYIAADRGMQSFDLAIPQGGGRLVLRITPGPNNDLAFDWTYWTDVKFIR